MLRIGLSGGIGSGKSSVARVFAGLGAVVIDADEIARAVVARGTPGLSAVTERFGAEVMTASGDLDRAALAARVFGDAEALASLERITHPLIWAEAARRFAAVPPGTIAVHDMPLLVEKRMSADYHLVVIVLTDTEARVRRLVEQRGLDEQDARRRLTAQVDDDARRVAADVLLDNNGPPEALRDQAEALWAGRVLPYAANLAAGVPAAPGPALPEADVAGQAARIASRVRHAIDGATRPAERPADWPAEAAGPTRARAVDGRLSLDVAIGAGDLDDAAAQRLAAAGFPAVTGLDSAAELSRLGNCDPAWPSDIRLVR